MVSLQWTICKHTVTSRTMLSALCLYICPPVLQQPLKYILFCFIFQLVIFLQKQVLHNHNSSKLEKIPSICSICLKLS